jgi:hypothetical protein
VLGVEWSTFLAVEFWALVTMATFLASAIAGAVGWMARTRSRPEADWAFWPRGVKRSAADPRHDLAVVMSNAGDGYAFRVSISGEHCKAHLRGDSQDPMVRRRQLWFPFVPLVIPGQEQMMDVQCLLEDWDRAVIIIEWTTPPTRLGRRLTDRVPLREIRPAPQPDEE